MQGVQIWGPVYQLATRGSACGSGARLCQEVWTPDYQRTQNNESTNYLERQKVMAPSWSLQGLKAGS